jgi:hypothetical protein
MALIDLPFRPGIFTDDTPRGAGKQAYWKFGNRVRFFNGLPQKLGGWKVLEAESILGRVRAAYDWARIDASEALRALGSHNALMIFKDNQTFDITPIESSGTLTDPFNVTEASTTVLVNQISHQRVEGDRVIFSGATAVGGITINGEYFITSVPSEDSYTIEHSSAATSSAAGGGTVDYEFFLSIGRPDTIATFGFGVGPYGVEAFSEPRTLTEVLLDARVWSLDNWGEDLVACPRGGGIYTWDASEGVGYRAYLIPGAPETARYIFVSYEDRTLIALGAHDGTAPNPMLIRWCDQENYSDWTPTLTNTAGDKQLDRGNEILCAMRARGDYLIFTDTYLFTMTFVGPPDTFAFRPVGGNGGLMGPNAARSIDGIVYWMAEGVFYVYDGAVKPLTCPVTRHVFDRLDRTQKIKVQCCAVREYNEVWWLYPVSTECDEYVSYNTVDGTWAIGTIDRTILVGDASPTRPYGLDPDGVQYLHEVGSDAAGEDLGAYIESGDFELGAGDQLQHISKIIPDFDVLTGTAKMEITAKKYPGSATGQTSGPLTVTPTTEKVSTRVRGRQVSIKVYDDAPGTDWRVGQLRLETRPNGGR